MPFCLRSLMIGCCLVAYGFSCLHAKTVANFQRATVPGVIVVKFTSTPIITEAGKATGHLQLDLVLRNHQVLSIHRFAPHQATPNKPGRTDLSRIYLVHFQDGSSPQRLAQRVASLDGVEYAEPKFMYQVDATPNDLFYAGFQSAYYDKMSLPAAFDEVRADTGTVVIAIVDGGTDWDHADLIGNVWNNPVEVINGLDDDGNGFIDDVRGWNFSNGTNDPTGLPQTPSSADHGTHVAGIACAQTHNATGVAGASWNARFLPICTASASSDGGISFGYEGILYATESGADIINCSWGGLGNSSAFEQEVINFAWERGTVVVAAAGNNNSNSLHYPSSYDHVLSVSNVDNADIRNFTSNWGTTVDVAAQGTSILSTGNGNIFATKTGTSMSSPHVAAVCALVKTKWPSFTADQVMQRVRVTADNIDGINPAFAGLLGFGRVNALSALTASSPAIDLNSIQVTTTNGDAILEAGETATLTLTVINQLDAASGIAFNLTENSAFATLSNNTASVTTLSTLESTSLNAFSLSIDPTTPINHTIEFVLSIVSTAPAYTDIVRFELTVLPITANHTANNVTTTISSVGKLGFGVTAGGTGKDGLGFIYKDSPNLIFEGALMMGNSAQTISDAARGANGNTQDDDFQTATNGVPAMTAPSMQWDEAGLAVFTDALAITPLNLHVQQQSFELNLPPYQDFVTLVYTIRNDGNNSIDNFYVGWFCDWDLDGANFRTNRTGFDAARGLGYCWDSGAGPSSYVGVTTLTSPGTTSFRGIWNDHNHPSNPNWGVYDGYLDSEKWDSLSGGISVTNAGPEDISFSLATGPFSIPVGQQIQVAFAFLGGDDLSALQSHVDAAQALWLSPPTDTSMQPRLPRRLALFQNHPNPFNPRTRIDFDLLRSGPVLLRVYAPNGRLVRTLVDAEHPVGSHFVFWDGLNEHGTKSPSGTYFYRMTAEGQTITGKMQLIK